MKNRIHVGLLRSKILNIVFLFALLCLYAGKSRAEKVLVLKEDHSGKFIGDHYSHFKDHKYAYSFDQIRSDTFKTKFIQSNNVRSNFGNEELAVWNKLTVTNETDREWLLDVSVYTIDSLFIYIPDGKGGFKEIIEGRSQPFKNKKIKSNSFLIELNIPKGDTITMYVKVCAFIMQFPSQIYLKEDYINEAHKRDLLSGLFAGLILLVFFYNLFIWTSTKDRNYLFYAIYVFFIAIQAFTLNGFLSELIYDGILVGINIHGPFIVAIASIASLIFTTKFLETEKRTPRLDKVLRYFLIPIFILNCVFDLLNLRIIASILNQSIGVLSIIVIIIAAIYSYKSGLMSVRYFLLAKFFNFSGVIVFILKTFAVIPYNQFTNRAIEFGLSLEVIFFSFALADKINQYKKEKDAAIRKNQKLIEEQNAILEETVTERTRQFFDEKEKSDQLLLNILPQDIAEELKNTGEVKAKVFDSVAILFSDFQNFTKISSGYEASELIKEINIYFKQFDEIVTRHNVEKIKTIGDAYMAATGFVGDKTDSLKKLIQCAIEMQSFVNHRYQTDIENQHKLFEMRIGIHIGPVVTGVVGKKKFQFDLWGDAVNTAARMESNGETGQINVSEDVYNLLKDDQTYYFEYRGKLPVKGKGEMNMYFVRLKNDL